MGKEKGEKEKRREKETNRMGGIHAHLDIIPTFAAPECRVPRNLDRTQQ
jgi:hypothetical protein